VLFVDHARRVEKVITRMVEKPETISISKRTVASRSEHTERHGGHDELLSLLLVFDKHSVMDEGGSEVSHDIEGAEDRIWDRIRDATELPYWRCERRTRTRSLCDC
jgi:hypothetical protein